MRRGQTRSAQSCLINGLAHHRVVSSLETPAAQHHRSSSAAKPNVCRQTERVVIKRESSWCKRNSVLNAGHSSAFGLTFRNRKHGDDDAEPRCHQELVVSLYSVSRAVPGVGEGGYDGAGGLLGAIIICERGLWLRLPLWRRILCSDLLLWPRIKADTLSAAGRFYVQIKTWHSLKDLGGVSPAQTETNNLTGKRTPLVSQRNARLTFPAHGCRSMRTRVQQHWSMARIRVQPTTDRQAPLTSREQQLHIGSPAETSRGVLAHWSLLEIISKHLQVLSVWFLMHIEAWFFLTR